MCWRSQCVGAARVLALLVSIISGEGAVASSLNTVTHPFLLVRLLVLMKSCPYLQNSTCTQPLPHSVLQLSAASACVLSLFYRTFCAAASLLSGDGLAKQRDGHRKTLSHHTHQTHTCTLTRAHTCTHIHTHSLTEEDSEGRKEDTNRSRDSGRLQGHTPPLHADDYLRVLPPPDPKVRVQT